MITGFGKKRRDLQVPFFFLEKKLKNPLTFSLTSYIIIIERGKTKTGKQGGNGK